MITMTRGDNETLCSTVYADSTLVTAQSLTAATAITFTARLNTEAGSVIFTKTLSDGITVTSAAAGTLEISLAPDDTATLPTRMCVLVCQLRVTWSDGSINTVERLKIVAMPDV